MDHTQNADQQHAHFHLVARDVSMRAVTAVGLAGIGLIHLLDAIGKYSETRYIFWMYVGLMVASLAVAGFLLVTRSRAAWLGAAALAASAIAGYAISRTTGLPNATDDIGNWIEPLGLAALFVEGCVVVLSGVALSLPGRVESLADRPATSESGALASRRPETA